LRLIYAKSQESNPIDTFGVEWDRETAVLVPTADSPAARVKIGLSLSGGGFRASFFHIGVLSRLAELGILRRVEVISMVSGGSILGALYYIHVKNLLESKSDTEIGEDDADYVRIMERIHRDFRHGVQKNIRARAFLNLAKNIWMAKATYSRTDRIGDLYDKYFYKPAWGKTRPKRWFGLLDRQIAMSELKIRPPDEPNAFRPDEHNPGRRHAKVPVLLINATTLNTGHNWRFEAVRMGEPLPDDGLARDVYANVDKNMRLEPGYFAADKTSSTPHRAITARQREFPLAVAVAASASVPALFHPLSISGLYEGIRVQLVDGGVHDNQGLQGLFDTDCTHLIVSDASGQMADLGLPATRIPGVAGRSNSIFGDRVRDEQLMHAFARPEPIALMHLRKGLVQDVHLPLADGEEPVAAAPKEKVEVKTRSERFGVSEDAQRLLSRVRTDLDSFSDTEAFALMLDGYLMTDWVLTSDLRFADFLAKSPSPATPVPERWEFRAVADPTGESTLPAGYQRHLEVARQRFFKPIALIPHAVTFLKLLAAAVLLALVALAVFRWNDVQNALSTEWPVWWLLLPLGLPLLLVVLYVKERGSVFVRWPGLFLVSYVLPVLFAPLLWLYALVAVYVGTPIFNRLGRVRPESGLRQGRARRSPPRSQSQSRRREA
jgi:NTE family protein